MSRAHTKFNREAYDADRPISSSRTDRFGRSEFANRIASVIEGRKDASSIVIGIYGPWGEGKTSVLNMVVEKLQSNTDILVVPFNPWRFQDESHLISSFFGLLADKVGKSIKTVGENVGEVLRKYSDMLSPVGFGAKDLAKALASLRPAANLEKLKGRVEEMLGEFGKRIVVIMDDIDRLDKDEVRAVFKLVKLSADFPNMAYILAFDEERVARALAEKYDDLQTGYDFIEKIVQVPLMLPPANVEALVELTFEGINSSLELAGLDVQEPEAQRFSNLFVRTFESRLKTPRLAKRYINGLTFALPILKGEVNPIDLLLIEAIRYFYPSLYSAIRGNSSVFLGTDLDSNLTSDKATEEIKLIIHQSVESLSADEQRAVEEVIQELFPRTSSLLGNSPYGTDWYSTWGKEKRIASPEYFQRYFAYGVPPKDVSDRSIEELITSGDSANISHVVSGLKKLVAGGKADMLIRKLRKHETSLPMDHAVRLAVAVAQCGELFPQNRQIFGRWGASAFSQACVLISNLLKRVEDIGERDRLALRLADMTSPLPFAVEYARIISKRRNQGKTISIISDECETEVHHKIATRIAEEARSDTFFQRYPEDVLILYRTWSQTDAGAVRNSLVEMIQNNPTNALVLLENIMPLSTTGFGTRKEELERPEYDHLSTLVAPEIIITALQQTYGDFSVLEKATYEQRFNAPAKERAALSFIQLHNDVQQERSVDEEATDKEP